MAASMNKMSNYASGSMNDYGDRNQHNLAMRPGSTRPSGRFAPPIQNPGHAEPWDQISDEHRSEINDCVSLAKNFLSPSREAPALYLLLPPADPGPNSSPSSK